MGAIDDLGIRMYSYRDSSWGFHHSVTFQEFSLEGLIRLAHAMELGTLWITPGSMLSRQAKYLLDGAGDALGYRVSKKSDGTPRFLLVWRKEGNYAQRQSVKIGFPEHDDRWPWQEVKDARTLIMSIQYLQHAIGYEIAWSPGHTGQDLILEENRYHENWLEPSGEPIVIRKNLAKALQMKRSLSAFNGELYIHLFDKYAQHLAACTGANFGQGSPHHLLNDVPFNALTPGLWDVAGMGKLWTPELAYRFVELDDTEQERPLITEAWVWPEYHQLLRSWAEKLWRARKVLRWPDLWEGPGSYPYANEIARLLAFEAVKSIYTQALGWLAHESDDNKLYRPDWWSMIVAMSKRIMQFKIRQLTKRGFFVCFVDTDTIGVISSSPSLEPYKHIILDRDRQLGGFKHVKTARLTPEVIRTFEDDVKFIECYKALEAL